MTNHTPDTAPAPIDRQADFESFWLSYLRAHSLPATRFIHYFGVGVGAVCVITSVMIASWPLFWFGQLAGYAITMLGHAMIERNRTALLGVEGHPFWSLLCCYRMSFSALIGQIDGDLQRAGLPVKAMHH
ncbi:MAG: DUF962 domain-containing protein [Rhizomicrobium sp.]